MKRLQIQPNTIFLQGISLQGKIKIHNPDQYRAYFFSIIVHQDKNNQANFNNSQNFHSKTQIAIFPNKGLILPKCSQTIKIRPKLYTYLDDKFQLKLTYTDKNNYNMIKVKNKQITEQLEKTQIVQFIKVEIGTDFTRLKKQLEQQVHISSSLGRDTSNISIIKQKSNNSEQNQNTIVAELQISSQKQVKLFRVFEESNDKNKKVNSNVLTSSIKRPFRKQPITIPLSNISQARIDTTQILFLAMIAGVFFALGSNFGNLLFN